MNSVSNLIQEAVSHHQAGRLNQAETLYQQILQIDPKHPDALHLLGLIAHQVGRHDIAVDLIAMAIAANSSIPSYYVNLGSAHQAQGNLDAAIENYLTALSLKPDYVEVHNNLGNIFQAQGKLDIASEYFRLALNFNPDYFEANYNLGNALQALDRLDDASKYYYKVLALRPDFGEAHNNLGNVLLAQNKLEMALEHYHLALKLKPDFAETHNNLGSIFLTQGKTEAAAEHFRRALSCKPDFIEAYNNLGTALQDLKQLDEAISSFRKAITLKPDYAKAYYNLGNALLLQGNLAQAVEQYLKALALKPDYAEAHNNLGNALKELGQLEAAIEHYHSALSIKSDFVHAHNNMGLSLQSQGRLDEAVDSYRKELELKPDYAEAHNNLGNALQLQGKLDESIACYRKALFIKEDYAEVYYNLGNAFQAQGKLAEAIANFEHAILLKPDYAEAHNNLGNSFKDQGRLNEAIERYCKALEIKSDFADAYNNLLYCYGYHALLSPQEYLAQARGWELACVPEQGRQTARLRTFQRLPLTGRRLKVGYVSGDYRQHSVSYFIEQLFTHHDRAKVELYAYSTCTHRDAITARLQALSEHWVAVAGMSDDAIRDRIEADAIDVLIDLSGNTLHNRLGVFARRAAPVQAHYLGYFASTGLSEMDYWIGDEILTPPATDSHFSERVWRLPRVWVCYDGKVDAPVSNWQPCQDGSVWLGNFNNLGKLSLETLKLWARVLHALPEGKLLLKTRELSDRSNRQRILDTLSALGILPDRIELQDSSVTPDWLAHMDYYHRLDIALDPVGAVGGGTTTCDALWMGVPVIAREGDRMASRMTASMLHAIGHPEWIAQDNNEYINKVVELARNVEQRKVLRASQRQQMACSPLCDAQGLARSLENAYLEMFERWQSK